MCPYIEAVRDLVAGGELIAAVEKFVKE